MAKDRLADSESLELAAVGDSCQAVLLVGCLKKEIEDAQEVVVDDKVMDTNIHVIPAAA